MRKVSKSLGLLALLLAGTTAHAEVEADLDLRLVDSNGRTSFLHDGFGKLRFDADHDGLQLGRARIGYRAAPVGDWHLTVDGSVWNLNDRHIFDLTEAYAEWRPVPQSAWRSQVKIGAFYPSISLEHRARGWTNPYTISSSALNTWIGEELRTIGAQYSFSYLGTAEGHGFDAGIEAAVYAWNDPAGVVVALRGFALHDRQTTLFGRIGTYAFGGRTQRIIFSEIDHRPGFYVGGYLKTRAGLELRAMRYDNRGDTAAYSEHIDDSAWDTRFNSLGLRYETTHGTTLIAQGLDGQTAAGEGMPARWNFKTAFVLVAQEFGRFRLSARQDWFDMHQQYSPWPGPLSHDNGSALTVAGSMTLRENLTLIAEWLRINSTYNGRYAIGEMPHAVERSAQLALRLSL